MNSCRSNLKRKQEQLEWEDNNEFVPELLDDFEAPAETSFGISTSSRETSYQLHDFHTTLEDHFPCMIGWRNNRKRKQGRIEWEDINEFFSELLNDFEISTESSYQLLDFNPKLEDYFWMSPQTVNSDSEWYYVEKIQCHELSPKLETPERKSIDQINIYLFNNVIKFSPVLLDLCLSGFGSFDKLKLDKIYQSPEFDACFKKLVKPFVISFEHFIYELLVSSTNDGFKMYYFLKFVSSFKRLLKEFDASFKRLVNEWIAGLLNDTYPNKDLIFLEDFFPQSLEANSDDETIFLEMNKVCDLLEERSSAEIESENDLTENTNANIYSVYLKNCLDSRFSSSKNYLSQKFQGRVKSHLEDSDFRPVSNSDNGWMEQQFVILRRSLYWAFFDLGLSDLDILDKDKFDELCQTPEFAASFGLILGELYTSSSNDNRRMEEQPFFTERSETISDDETVFLEMKKICNLIDEVSPEMNLENVFHEIRENSYFDSVSVCLKRYLYALLSSLSKIFPPQKFEDEMELELKNFDLRIVLNVTDYRMEQQAVNLCWFPYLELLDLGFSKLGLFDKDQFEKGYQALRILLHLSNLLMNCLKETELLIREKSN